MADSDPVMKANFIDPLMEVNDFLRLQEARNICAGAYREVTMKVLEAKGIKLPPMLGLGSLEFLDEMFSSPPPQGMRVQWSVETARFPVQSNILVSMMMNVDIWASSLPELIYRASNHYVTDIFRQLLSNDNIVGVKMVNAEVRLPTHLCETRKFRFLRFQRGIIDDDTWAIIDISDDYFLDSQDRFKSERMCRRRPSGVVIRGDGNYSDVIWIENVEVYEDMLENSIYSRVLDSNIAFCAKHWVSTLYHKFHRHDTKIFKQMSVNWIARPDLLFSHCDHMKMIFSQFLHEYPDGKKFATPFDEEKMTILSDEHEIRILNDGTTVGYIGLTSFLVKAKPISVFQYLKDKDIQLEWPGMEHRSVGEQIMHVTECPYNRITLYSERDYANISSSRRLLQEISKNDFCSYVISAPLMTQEDAIDLLREGLCTRIPIRPTGFAIMPDGSGGLHSDASLVTIVIHKQFDDGHEADHAMNMMIDYVTMTMTDIEEYAAE